MRNLIKNQKRFYERTKNGDPFISKLRTFIEEATSKGAEFLTLREMTKEAQE